MRVLYLVIVCILFLSPLTAQDDVEHDFQYWFDIIVGRPLNEKARWFMEGGYRSGADAELGGLSWSTGYLRPAFRYDISREISAHGGFALFYRFRDDFPDSYELRPWLGTRIGWPRLGPIRLRHYFRLEQRYFRFRNEIDPFSLTRFRYQFGTSVPLKSNSPNRSKSIYLPIKYEFFWHFQETSSRKERFAGGLGFFLDQTSRLETLYTAEMIRSRSSGELVRVEHVIRVQLKF